MESVTTLPEGFLNPDAVVGQFGIVAGMRIADFGCGAGHIALLIAEAVGKDGKVTALDILEDKLDSMRAKAKSAGLENIDTIRANLEVLGSSGLSDGSQDMVVLFNTLFQSQKKEDIIKEAGRVLKSGGTIAVVEWKRGAGGLGPPDGLRVDEENLKNIFARAGFTMNRPFPSGQFHYGFIFTKP